MLVNRGFEGVISCSRVVLFLSAPPDPAKDMWPAISILGWLLKPFTRYRFTDGGRNPFMPSAFIYFICHM